MGTERDSSYYDKVLSEDKKYRGSYRNLPHFPIFQIALSHIKDSYRPFILELGCGTGQFARFLWDNWYREYVGVDFSEKAIEIACKLSPQVFEVQDLSVFKPYPIFNTIVCLETLEHIENDLGVLERIDKGNTVIISVPRFDDPAHVRFFKSKEEVTDRYEKLIKIDEFIKYQNWYILKGKRNGTHASSPR